MTQVLNPDPLSGMLPRPETWGYHYSGNTRCDMLIGPCACGGWHKADDWVHKTLKEHDAVIETIHSIYCPICRAVLTHLNSPMFQCQTCGWIGHARDAIKEISKMKMKMPYLSIDIETTGLDPDTCQILEIGAVYDDGRTVDVLPIYHRYVVHKLYVGDPFALALNEKILHRLSNITQEDWRCGQFIWPEEVADNFVRWLKDKCHWNGKTGITPAGKNFSSFDLQFLQRLPRFKEEVKLNHRCIDPAILYFNPETDDKLPDTKTCMERAGFKGNVAHTAVEDAQVVVKLVRLGIRRLSKPQ